VWALTLFENEAPFRVPAPAGARGRYSSVASLAAVTSAPRGVELAVGAKVRPVLLLQDRPLGRLPELVALKLARIGKLSASARARIVAQRSPLFWFLGRDPARYGLRQEAAIDVAAIVRIHPSAIAGRPVAVLDDEVMAEVAERLARVLELDLSALVRREAAAILREDLDR
jgi:mRNA-degrading endonuclease toxin of MazEF toxin-antitoxin module